MNIGDSASAQELIMVGQMSIRYLIDGTATGGMGIFELSVPPKSNVPPPHSHTANEECAYVLEGVLRYAVDGVARDLRPGDWMFTPRGSVHQFSNPHDELARALIVLTPDIGAQYFRDVSAVVNVGGPPDRTKLLGVMAKYSAPQLWSRKVWSRPGAACMIPSQDRGWEGMMARRSPFEIRLTAAERDKLELTARKYTLPHREVVRAKIVLYAADGLSNQAIAARLDTPREVVSRWRKRFHKKRLDGLEDGPRSGRPTRFSPLRGRGGEGPRV